MPELPEVETIRAQLSTALPGLSIQGVERAEPFMLRDASEEDLGSLLPGSRFLQVERRGKFLVLALSGDLFLTIHLGMTGALLLLRAGAQADREVAGPHARFVFALDQGQRLLFRDARKFGRLHLTRGRPAARLDLLGPDAWQGVWDEAYLAKRLAGQKTPVKAFLLDQRHLAGIGNIYADEILFAARISPLRPAGALSRSQIHRLAGAIRQRLDDGVKAKGCSISDYVDATGRPGSFQEELCVYGRSGQVCPRCGRLLTRAIVAGRGTSSCPKCQT